MIGGSEVVLGERSVVETTTKYSKAQQVLKNVGTDTGDNYMRDSR